MNSADDCCRHETLLPVLPETEARSLADRLAAVADPARIRLLDLLARSDGQVCVCDLVAALGLAQPTISHHLRLLRAAGLVDFEKRGVWAYYFVRGEALRELCQAAAALAGREPALKEGQR